MKRAVLRLGIARSFEQFGSSTSGRPGPVANDYLEIGSSDVFQDPWDELGDPRANAG